jgi:hypothetical protein
LTNAHARKNGSCEGLNFPGAATQGFDLPDARLMIASAMEYFAQILFGRRQDAANSQHQSGGI